MFTKLLNQQHFGLSQKYLLGMVTGLLITVIFFAALFFLMYQTQIESGRKQASTEITELLQVSMEQPFINQDRQGLQKLIDRLAQQTGITNVMVANTLGVIRFSSLPELIGVNPLATGAEGCVHCHDRPPKAREKTVFLKDEQGREVLRSVSPIINQPECVSCHGRAVQHPYTGMLVVDYDAAVLRQQARNTTLVLMSSGSLVLLITLWGGWWFMQHVVLAPVNVLTNASEAVAKGHLETRVEIEGHDELAQLGDTFNRMAHNLQQAMEAVQAKEAFQQLLIDAIPDGVRVIDADYRIVAVNAAYREQLQIVDDKADAGPIGACCYQSSHGRDTHCVPTLTTCPLHELQSGTEPIRYLDHHQCSDGRSIDVEVYAAPLRLDDGGRQRLLIVESIRDLSRQVSYSHEQKLSDLGRLAAGIAHEIRNPLTTLKLALARLGSERVTEQERDEYLDLISREIDRCIAVNQRLLKLSAVPPSSSELVDVNDAVAETVSLLNLEAQQRQITIEMDLGESQPRAVATDSEIRMIVLNLVQNAFHAVSPGGHVRVSTAVQDAELYLSVEDNGHGIAAAERQHIFEPFFSHRPDGIQGTGLGLSITKSLVTRHAGTIHVTKSVLGGACFELTFKNADYQ